MQCSAECSSSTYDIAKATFDFHASLVTDDGRYRERRKVQLAKVDAETEEKRGKKRRSPSVNSQSEWRPERVFFSSRGSCVYLSPLPHLVSRQSAVGTLSSRVMLFVPELFMSFPKIGRYLHRDKADGYGGVTSGHGHIPRRGMRRR